MALRTAMTELLRVAPRSIGLATACIVGVSGLVATVVVTHQAGHRAATELGVHAIGAADIAVVDLGDVAVTVRVTNHGTSMVIPTCQVQVKDLNDAHHGARTVTLGAPLEPGQTTSFTAKVRVSGQGAGSITQATATCA
jgi:hypothetical protein